MAGFEPLCSGATRVCLELSLVQFLVLHIHQETLSELSPPKGKHDKMNYYLAVGAYVHGVHSEGKNQIKAFQKKQTSNSVDVS